MASTKQLLAGCIRDRFDVDRAEEIIGDDAFGALLFRVKEYCRVNECNPSDAFDSVSDDDIEFAAEDADNPAAFLAARIRDAV